MMAFVNAPSLLPLRRTHTRATSARRARTPSAAMAVPAADRVLVRVDDAATKTAGGLLLGKEEEAKRPNTGTVLAVGPGRFSPHGERETIDLEVGDHVLWKDSYGVETIDPGLADGEGEVIAIQVYHIVSKW